MSLDQFVRDDVAKTVDVERGARGKMLEPLRRLRRAVGVDAAPRHEFLVLVNRAATLGTLAAGGGDHVERLGPDRPQILYHGDDSGNDVTAFLDDDRVSDTDVLATDFLFVVQRSAADGGAVDKHWLQLGHRRESAGAAYLNGDGVQPGLRLLRRVLVGHRPARRHGQGAARSRRSKRFSLMTAPSVS